MSGCYHCGHPDGSEVRLCETCYRLKFHRERDVNEIDMSAPAEGVEMTPSVQRALISSGLAFYLGLVSFSFFIHHRQVESDPQRAPFSYVAADQYQTVVSVHHAIGDLEAPS
jgi:hypothetical protein